MSAHTKGPWTPVETFSTHNSPSRYWETSVRAAAGYVGIGVGATEEEAKANAHLIAAAPELFGMLKRILCEDSECDGMSNGAVEDVLRRTNVELVDEALALIVKAEGRA